MSGDRAGPGWYEARRMPFLGAHPSLLQALIERGITEPTPVQRAILEVGDASADLMVSAQTGSGKTVAFGLAIAPNLLGEENRLAPMPRDHKVAPSPHALVVAPTRELALQVATELTWLYAQAGGVIATCVGGMDPRREQQALGRGPHIVVGTPGRLCDHLDRGALGLATVKAVILDEADEMLDMGFRDELERILKAAPEPPARRTLLFSATIPPGIAALAKRYTRGAIRLQTTSEATAHADIEHRAVLIRPIDRVGAVVNVLRLHEAPSSLVFCATRDGVTNLAGELTTRGFDVVALSGELSQRERTLALTRLREGHARVLVATDVAARGLDLPALELVIHADLPQNREVMIHRSGRTGRAGRKGTSVLLVPMARRGFVERVLAPRGTTLTWSPAPTAAEIEARDLDRLDDELARDLAALGERDRELGRALAAKHSAEDLAALVVRGRLAAAPAPAKVAALGDGGGHDDRGAGSRPRTAGPPPRGGLDRARGDFPRRDDALRARAHAGPARGDDRPPPRRGADDRDGGGDGGDDRPMRPSGDFAVFKVNIGRRGNADPRWLIPLLCRRGEIDKRAIGKINVLGNETHVEISKAKAAAFAEAAARPDPRDKKLKITPL